MSQGFDFNKWIKEGIPYLPSTVETNLKEAIQKKSELFTSPNFLASGGSQPGVVKGPVIIPPEHQEFIDDICKKVEKFIESAEGEELALAPSTAFQRKLTYQMLEYKFSSDVYLQAQTGENKQRYILVTKIGSQDDFRRMEEKRLALQMADIDDAVGFARVIKHLSQSGKLIVGHNMYLDVVHTIHQFLYPLPQDYEEFKLLCQGAFPRLIDTKLMANTQPFKDRIEASVLGQLLEITQRAPFRKPEVELAGGFDNRYKENDVLHEAGFDAYITGKCFISLANYLGQCHNPPLERVTPKSPLLGPFLNKIFMMRSPDVPYMNLAGPDLNPSRDLVFHLSFPPDWRYDNIAALFKGFGGFHVDWIDDSSVFVVLNYITDAERVLKTLCKKGSVYELMSFHTYKDLLKKSVTGNCTNRQESVPKPHVEQTVTILPSSPQSSNNLKRSHSPPTTDEKVKKLRALNADAPAFESRITPTSTPEKEEEEFDWSDKSNSMDKQFNDGAMDDKLFDVPDDW